MPKTSKSKTKGNADLKAKCRIITPKFRVSYPHVFKAVQVNGKGEPKYSITMLFKKSADISKLKTAIKYAKIAAFGKDENEWPEMDSVIIDGDKKKYRDKEGYKGHFAVKATSFEDSKPGVVDADGELIVNVGDFYPGCYAHAQVFARVWEFSGKYGVHFILDHVQKLDDGKSLSSKQSVTEVFGPTAGSDDDEDDEEDEDESEDEEDDEEDEKPKKGKKKKRSRVEEEEDEDEDEEEDSDDEEEDSDDEEEDDEEEDDEDDEEEEDEPKKSKKKKRR